MKKTGTKSSGFKELALKHSEKVGVLVIGLLVLFVLYGSNWKPYQTHPDELQEKAQDAQANVHRSTWPDDERKRHLVRDELSQGILAMTEEIDLANYRIRTLPAFPMRRSNQLLREPKVFEAMKPVAKTGKFYHQLTLVATKDEDKTVTTKKKQTDDDLFDHLPEEDKDDKEKGKPPKKIGPRSLDGGPGTPGQHKKQLFDGKGRRYIVVLALVDLKKQIEEHANALSTSSFKVRYNHIAQYRYFNVQRRHVFRDGKPISGWIDLSFNDTMKILEKSDGYADEVVDTAYTNKDLTSPLPPHINKTGEWGNNVSHPDLKVLDEGDQELQAQIDKILREFVKNRKKEEEKNKGGSQGFRTLNDRDSKTEDDILKDPNERKKILDILLQDLDQDDPKRAKIEAYLSNRTKTNRYLVRFFDFDVEPNRWYQYRIKLVMQNPLHNTAHASLEPTSKDSRNHETIVSGWSEPTKPSSTGNDYKYYLTSVVRSRGLGWFHRINVDLFTWVEKYGVLAKGKFTSMQVGDPIGGQNETIMPLALIRDFKKTSVSFHTGNYLVDILPSPIIDRDMQRDLGLRREAGVTEEITVIDEYGDLKVVDRLSQRPDWEKKVTLMARYHKKFESWRKKDKDKEKQPPGGTGKLGAPDK